MLTDFDIILVLLILTLLPHQVVFLVDIEFDSVISSSYSGNVPLESLDFTTLVKVADSNSVEEADHSTGGDSQAEMLILVGLLLLRLDTLVLHEEYSIGSEALIILTWIVEQVIVSKGDRTGTLSNKIRERVDQSWVVWCACSLC